MKLKLFTLVFLLLSACTSYVPKRDLPAPAPNSRIILKNGDYVSLNQFKSRTLVLTFWQATCSKSKKLIPKLNELAKEKTDVNFVAVSLDKESNFEFYSDYIKHNAPDLIHAFSGNEGGDEAFRTFGGRTVPLIVIIKNDQIVVMTDDFDNVQKELSKP